MSAATTSVERRAGEGALVFTRVGKKTVSTTVRATSPLCLLTPQNHGDAAWAYLSTFGGGFVDGDSVAIDVTLERAARAYLATQSSTKVYRGSARMTLDARVAEGALLALIPDPLMCFAGARYAQRIAIDLQPSASLVMVDALTAGRCAYGEKWAFSRYESLLSIDCPTHRLLHDPVRFDVDESPIARRFGRFEAMATLVLLGPALSHPASALLSQWASRPVERKSDALITASPLGDGVIARVVATSARRLGEVLRETLFFLPTLLGDDPFARKF